jgi:hypothetical protein
MALTLGLREVLSDMFLGATGEFTGLRTDSTVEDIGRWNPDSPLFENAQYELFLICGFFIHAELPKLR